MYNLSKPWLFAVGRRNTGLFSVINHRNALPESKQQLLPVQRVSIDDWKDQKKPVSIGEKEML